MNDIAKQDSSNLPAELAGLGTAMIQEGATMGGVQDLLKFLSREGGLWVFGVDATEIEPDSQWAINPLSFEYGWVCWKDSKIAGEAMVPVGVAKATRDSLTDHGTDSKDKAVSWDEQMACRLMCVSGEDTGIEVNYRTSTYGGLQAIKSVMKAVGTKINSGAGEVVAIVELKRDHYMHPDFGKTYTPELEIVSWTLMDVAPEEEAEEEPKKPTRASRAKPAKVEEAVEEEEVAEEKPRARRRRVASK